MVLRDLPSVNDVLGRLGPAATRLPQALVVVEVRRALDAARAALKAGSTCSLSIEATVEAALAAWRAPSLRHVINATGVVLHTNLGRAPLSPIVPVQGYSNLEYDLEAGRRGKRDVHVSPLLDAILGRPAVVVNNGAAALFLVLNELALGGEALVSRGELIEIGDGFRIPEIMQRSGARLHEVGTTNRTHIDDYRNAIGDQTRVILRVHPSNFRMTGFTARPGLAELVQLGHERGIPVYEDLGSGCIVDLGSCGIHEPLAQDSLAAGANLISFSGDKLLGGPQAGIIAGDAGLVARVRRNPLFRALRQDKLFHQAMETTLRHILFGELDCVPALRMIRMSAAEIRLRAESLAGRIKTRVRLRDGESVIGGGATPEQSLPTCLIVIDLEDAVAEERRLRLNDPPIIARIERDRVVLDLRTVFPEEEDAIAKALERSGSFLICAFGRVHANLLAFADERRHLHHQTCLHLRGFGHIRNRRAFETGFRFDDGHVNGRGEFHADCFALVKLDGHFQLRDEVIGRVSEQFLRQVHLLVVFGIHEVVILAVVVQVLHFLLIQLGLFNFVFGGEAMLGHGAGTETAHFCLHKASQITWRAVSHAEDGIQFVIELDHHSRAQLCCGKHGCLGLQINEIQEKPLYQSVTRLSAEGADL